MKQALKATLDKDITRLKELVGNNMSILHQVIAEASDKDSEYESADLYSATFNLLELIKDDRVLLEKVLNAPDNLGVTLISKALELGQVGMVKTLLKYPSINVTKENWAAISNLPSPKEVEIYRYLAKHKAALIAELIESERKVSVEDLEELLVGDATPFKYCSRETLENLGKAIGTEYPLLKDFIRDNEEQLDKLFRTLDSIVIRDTKNKALALQNKNKITVAMEILQEGLWLNDDTELITTIMSFRNESLINAIKARYDEVTPKYLGLAVLQALEFGLVDQVKPLIDAGADVNVRDTVGYTPLMWAVYMKNTEAVRQLVESGAVIDEFMLTGDTALMFAAQGGYYDIVDILLKAGADINARNTSAESPLTLAIKNGHIKIVKELVARGAGFDEITLNLAVKQNNAEVVRILLLNGADPHKASVAGHVKLEGKEGKESWVYVATRGNDEVKAVINQYLDMEKKFKENFESKIIAGIESHDITIDNIEAKVESIIDQSQPAEMQEFAKRSAEDKVKAVPEEHKGPEGLSFVRLLIMLIMKYFSGRNRLSEKQENTINSAVGKLNEAVRSQPEFEELSGKNKESFVGKIEAKASQAKAHSRAQ